MPNTAPQQVFLGGLLALLPPKPGPQQAPQMIIILVFAMTTAVTSGREGNTTCPTTVIVIYLIPQRHETMACYP